MTSDHVFDLVEESVFVDNLLQSPRPSLIQSLSSGVKRHNIQCYIQSGPEMTIRSLTSVSHLYYLPFLKLKSSEREKNKLKIKIIFWLQLIYKIYAKISN